MFVLLALNLIVESGLIMLVFSTYKTNTTAQSDKPTSSSLMLTIHRHNYVYFMLDLDTTENYFWTYSCFPKLSM